MSITLKELGERIRLLRGERSQAAIAAKAGIAQGYWSEIERGEKVPKLDVLFKIAKALGYDLHIFEEDSNDKKSSTVGEEPVWIDIVEPVACAGSGNGYHEISWKPIGQMPLSPFVSVGQPFRTRLYFETKKDGATPKDYPVVFQLSGISG